MTSHKPSGQNSFAHQRHRLGAVESKVVVTVIIIVIVAIELIVVLLLLLVAVVAVCFVVGSLLLSVLSWSLSLTLLL